MHYMGVTACIPALAWSPPYERVTPACGTWESISLLSNSISTRQGFSHSGPSVKVAEKKRGCGFSICRGADSFSLPSFHLSFFCSLF